MSDLNVNASSILLFFSQVWRFIKISVTPLFFLQVFILNLSGYRVRLNNQKPDANNPSTSNTSSGRLHVDFAQARDDQYEYECQARRLERELRHRQRIEEDKWRPPSPPPVPHYAEHEAHVVVEQLKGKVWSSRSDLSYLA
jgi:hypothetical protein